jgi:CrcB protein
MRRVTALLVAVAGALGVLARYGVDQAFGPAAAPWSVLGVNVLGSLALGALVGAGAGEHLRAVAGIGFLGGFTTFSTFALQVVAELDAGRPGRALALAAGSVLLGVGAAAAGHALASRA